MKKNKLPNQIIDDYLMGRLQEADAHSFRQRLGTDTALAKKVELRQKIITGIEAYGRKELRNKLKIIKEKKIGTSTLPTKRSRFLPYLAAAASVLILAVALFWLVNQKETKSLEQVYAAYFEPYDLSASQRSGNDEQVIYLEQLYKNKKYVKAVPIFESVLAIPDNRSSGLLLAAGISHLELEQAEKALFYFQEISANGDFSFKDEVRWYSGLAYLKLEDLDAAKKVFQELAADKMADHHDEAVKLLKDLN